MRVWATSSLVIANGSASSSCPSIMPPRWRFTRPAAELWERPWKSADTGRVDDADFGIQRAICGQLIVSAVKPHRWKRRSCCTTHESGYAKYRVLRGSSDLLDDANSGHRTCVLGDRNVAIPVHYLRHLLRSSELGLLDCHLSVWVSAVGWIICVRALGFRKVVLQYVREWLCAGE